jgi:hypothetical protein
VTVARVELAQFELHLLGDDSCGVVPVEAQPRDVGPLVVVASVPGVAIEFGALHSPATGVAPE